ncbi:MAG: hypothetical protein HZB65_03945 [Candidatus Aenigmarchaeota archaeon]|nr:hypothetical protein [Candidatus Aenigmarchaeota archaeon]
MVMIAVTGGTGFSDKAIEKIKVETDFGDAYIGVLEIAGKQVYLIERHYLLDVPHRVNYKANIQALKILNGDTDPKKYNTEPIVLYEITAASRLHESVLPGHLVILDDVDWDDLNRPMSYTDDGHVLLHVSMTPTFSEGLRNILKCSWKQVESEIGNLYHNSGFEPKYHENGTYFNIQGPAFSTNAREYRLRKTVYNPKLIGQTEVPAVQLAREMEIAIAVVGMCVDHSNFPGASKVTHTGIMKAVETTALASYKLVEKAIENTPDDFFDPDFHRSLDTGLVETQINLEELKEIRPHLAAILENTIDKRTLDTI